MIRRAFASDIPVLCRMADRFVDEAYGHGVDHAAFGAMIEHLMEDGCVFMAEKDGEPIGAAAMMRAPKWFNPAIVIAMELFWWVEPEHRNGTAGMRLLNAMEEWAAQNHLQPAMCVVGLKTDHIKHLYKRRGYREIEACFLKE